MNCKQSPDHAKPDTERYGFDFLDVLTALVIGVALGWLVWS